MDAGRAIAGKISLGTATAIVIADMVGIGVFTSLGFQIEEIPSPFSLLLLWAVGGAVAVCGALSYAELVAMLISRTSAKPVQNGAKAGEL